MLRQTIFHSTVCLYIFAIRFKSGYIYVVVSETPSGAVTWWPRPGQRDYVQFSGFGSFSLFLFARI